MAYRMAASVVTLKVIHRLQAFSEAIRRTFVQHFTRFHARMVPLDEANATAVR